jgi:hypothetical protein
MSFIQATGCFFRTELSDKKIIYTPSDGANQFDLNEEFEILPQSFWNFNDPNDYAKEYLAIFPSVDNFREKIYSKIIGKVFHIDSENYQDLESSRITHKEATMIITGESNCHKTLYTYIVTQTNVTTQ